MSDVVVRGRQVPDSWFRACCERQHHPVACIGDDNRFIWANTYFERLTGYSLAELRHRTWQSITVDEDVGADLRNVEAVLGGYDLSYTMSKRYRHKRGHLIPITLTVWRHQSKPDDPILLIVQAIPDNISDAQLEKLIDAMQSAMVALQQRMDAIEAFQSMKASGNSSNINIGDRNSASMIQWLVIAVIALAIMVGWIAYYSTWNDHQGKAQPPNLELPKAP